MFCSMLQFVDLCGHMSYVAALVAGYIRRSVLQCVAMLCSALQCVAVCWRVYGYASDVAALVAGLHHCNVLQCVAVCCSMLQCV